MPLEVRGYRPANAPNPVRTIISTFSTTETRIDTRSILPALGLPAGFSEDGLPIGMELLGRTFAESDLLSLGFAIEQTLTLRRLPFSTPRLIAGKRPPLRTSSISSSGTTVDVVFDETTSRLQYTIKLAAAERQSILAIWLHSGTPDKPGAARHQLYSAGTPTTGQVTLSAAERRSVLDTGLLLRFYREGSAAGTGDMPIVFGSASGKTAPLQ